MTLFNTKLCKALLAISLAGILAGCQQDQQQTPEALLESLPHLHPKQVNQFQQADSVYFAHLGYKTVPLAGGNVLLYDRTNSGLWEVSPRGELVQHYTRSGKGPGEVLDIRTISKTREGEVVLYDQKNNKIVHFDETGKYVNENVPASYKKGLVSQFYLLDGIENYLVRFNSFSFLMDKTKEPKSYLVPYNATDNTYGESLTLEARTYARLIMDGQVRGGTEVSFSPRQLIANNPDAESLYLFWTGSNQVAEISPDFDTLRTIPVDLPAQQLSSTERDSIKEEHSDEQWDTLSELLPDQKVPVEKMKVDPEVRFWVKLNYRSDSDLWLILNQEGNPQKVVHLPAGSMLTHISDDHLGVRLDDVTFALYEAVE
ncbi:6-bladed beta-propeller [Aliifodinibius sp. S!AR15-10]|uniref:6-bladed beta-propeller n=1 Tax=Aliifodinibius sp. S!AR15-10 TaxID=2950437 RepID=UPI0028672388|nr:6-bladed beta-propeller [Aliifodinibius sp. S!AR15-10]MDR8394569.1 6-bladed beta-propeller [Aliifodinibius sp. S!AR15-10]